MKTNYLGAVLTHLSTSVNVAEEVMYRPAALDGFMFSCSDLKSR